MWRGTFTHIRTRADTDNDVRGGNEYQKIKFAAFSNLPNMFFQAEIRAQNTFEHGVNLIH